MEFMVSMSGEPDQRAYLAEIAGLGAGIELGSYGLVGIRSKRDWDLKIEKHVDLVNRFPGKIALHGPFLGIEYALLDHLIREAIQRRMDMTFEAARAVKAGRVILHSGYSMEKELFHLNELWLSETVAYWKTEISRWENAGIEIVLENDVEKSPDLLVDLVEKVNSPSLRLCLDVGHLHYVSPHPSDVWVEGMGRYLRHVHIHDNDQMADRHWPVGRGTFDFDAFFASIEKHSPDVTMSIEVEGTMEEKLADLRKVIQRFRK